MKSFSILIRIITRFCDADSAWVKSKYRTSTNSLKITKKVLNEIIIEPMYCHFPVEATSAQNIGAFIPCNIDMLPFFLLIERFLTNTLWYRLQPVPRVLFYVIEKVTRAKIW